MASSFKYEHIAEHLTRLIQQKRYRPGDRLPSLRQLCEQFEVSQSTVLTVFSVLESRGLVEIRPQSGCYVAGDVSTPMSLPSKSAPTLQTQWVDLNDILVNTTASGLDPEIIPFGVVAPDPALIPYKELNRMLATVCRSSGPESAYYDFAPGNLEFREEMARRSHHWGCDLQPDDFVATSGTLEALNVSFKSSCKPGDVVAVESPAYYGMLQILGTLGLQALEIPTSPETGIDLDILEANLAKHKVRAVALIPNFNNPMGFVMPDTHKQRLAELATERDIVVIEDDVYGDLNYGPIRPKPIKAFDTSGNVMLCSSFSKALIPSYRSGWCVPGKYLSEARRYKWMSSAANASLPQLAIIRFVKRGGYDKHLRRFRKILASQMTTLSRCVQHYFPEDIRMTRPVGGYTLWIELPKTVDSLIVYQKALEQKISITPGPVFSSTGQYPHFIRLNYGFPWQTSSEQAVDTLATIIRSLM